MRDGNLVRHIFNRREMMKFFSLNRDLFFRTLALVAVNLFFTAQEHDRVISCWLLTHCS